MRTGPLLGQPQGGALFARAGSGRSGSRVQALTLSDGAPIPDDASSRYRLAFPDHVFYGGTGYEALAERPGPAPTAGPLLEEAVGATCSRGRR